MSETKPLRMAQRVIVSTKTQNPQLIGNGIYLGEDLIFLDRIALAQASRFIVELARELHTTTKVREFRLEGNVQAYIEPHQGEIVKYEAPAHSGTTIQLKNFAIKRAWGSPLVVASADLSYRTVWLILSDLPIPRQNPFALVA